MALFSLESGMAQVGCYRNRINPLSQLLLKSRGPYRLGRDDYRDRCTGSPDGKRLYSGEPISQDFNSVSRVS